jgi:hypothetical protein
MARRRQQQPDGSSLRREMPAGTDRLREERHGVQGDREGSGDTEPPKWLLDAFRRHREVRDNNPLYLELFHHPIQLRENGYGMEWGAAQSCVGVLRSLQENPILAKAFTSLVALAKPRGVTLLQVKVSRRGLAQLRGLGLVDQDGQLVNQDLARVLDASLTATETGEVVLVDPVAYTKEFVAKYAAVDQEIENALKHIDWQTAREAAAERRRKGDRGEGRAR